MSVLGKLLKSQATLVKLLRISVGRLSLIMHNNNTLHTVQVFIKKTHMVTSLHVTICCPSKSLANCKKFHSKIPRMISFEPIFNELSIVEKRNVENLVYSSGMPVGAKC